jgi:hypothetical protein
MKKFIIALLALQMIACQSEPANSSSAEIKRMKEEIEKKRNEITDQKELARLEEEAKRLDNELKQLTGDNSTPTAPKTTGQAAPSNGSPTGTIKGNSVTMRDKASTQGNSLGAFNNNEVVTILKKQRADNAGEAILKTPIDLFTGVNGTGEKSIVLPKGKAIFIQGIDDSSGKVYVSYKHPEKGTLYAMIPTNAIEDIESSIWYQVKRSNGQTAWVFGKFLSENK